MKKEDIVAFIKTKKHAVISTYSPDEFPEAALIGFGESDDLEIIFGTYKTSRKYKNLKINNKVAFVIGWGEELITVQYEGLAFELDESESEKYLSLYHKKMPSAIIYKTHPDQSYWRVQPKWIRYSDLSGEKGKVVELVF
jgi:pyridoxine/pyridoxamine 5'-phosphate oxidase